MTQSQRTELLIHTVKKYPVLYDPCHEDSKRRRTRDEVWTSIAELIGEDRDKIKFKWKNLRDSYGKHIRSTKPHNLTGYAAKVLDRYKTWPWVKQMSFLRPFLEPALIDHDEAYRLSTQNDAPFDEVQTPSQFRRHRKRAFDESDTQMNEEVINLLNNKDNYDNTDLIFLGYSKLIKQMTKRRQATVKFQIAKVIMEAELEQCDSPVNFRNGGVSGKCSTITNPLTLKCEYAEEVEPEHNSSDSFDT